MDESLSITSLSDLEMNENVIQLPLNIPFSFINENTEYTVTLPITLPMRFSDGSQSVIKLPITLPMMFESKNNIRKTCLIPYREYVDLDEKIGKVVLRYHEEPYGKIKKIKYSEKAWYFPGLILSENIISEQSAQLNIVENIQALILVDFELVSTNVLKLTWHGSNVPSFTVMKKSLIDDDYTADKTYNWSADSALVEITSEDYNIYLQGTANSGTSAVYSIGSASNLLVEPEVKVELNNKIHTLEVNYTSTYSITINY